jgi:hypothetical protein
MMDNSVKHALKIGLFIMGGSVVAAFIWYELRLVFIYNNISTVNEAIADIQSPNTIFIEFNNSSISTVATAGGSDTGAYQYSDDGGDQIDAVQFNGNTYTGDATTGIYYGIDGSVYDSNADTLTMPDGTVSNIDPSTVVFGTLDSDGTFVND